MEWKHLRLYPNQSVRDALTLIDVTGEQFAIVTDDADVLVGVITDGNVRRSLLAGISLESSVHEIMNASPVTTDGSMSAPQVLRYMEARSLSHLPAIDERHAVLRVWRLKDLQSTAVLPNSAVIMAGGLGSRLGELTKSCPKPMLRIGDKPILEIVLDNFMRVGFRNFYFAVNYMAEMVSDYFGNGKNFNCSISYLHENKRLGTAGALSLLPPQEYPFVVSNADILTHLNMRCLLHEHLALGGLATMVVKKHSVHVPYGVVECDEHRNLLNIKEKPSTNFFISAGIYVIAPSVLQFVPVDTFFDMPALFSSLIEGESKARIMETDEYWLDVGQISDFERAQKEF